MGLPEPSTAGTALVTGASSGIGAEIAKELARRGLHLTSVAGRGERLRSLSEEIAGKHGAQGRGDRLPLNRAGAHAPRALALPLVKRIWSRV